MMKRLLSLFAVLLLVSAIGFAQKKPAKNVARKAPAKAGKATAARLAVRPVKFSGPCPAHLLFAGSVTTNGPAEVSYTFKSFDGGTWGAQHLKFEKAGSQNVSQDWQLGGAGQTVNGWLQLEVTSPNAVHSTPAKFTVVCSGGHVKTPPRVIKKK